jgi:hypothetical protein
MHNLSALTFAGLLQGILSLQQDSAATVAVDEWVYAVTASTPARRSRYVDLDTASRPADSSGTSFKPTRLGLRSPLQSGGSVGGRQHPLHGTTTDAG